ncbi:Citrate synthase [Plasmodiophora brassicae]
MSRRVERLVGHLDGSAASAEGVDPKNSLTVTDNRTGKKYQLPIYENTIKAEDLGKIKGIPNEPGLRSYDPGYLNTSSATSRVCFIDGDKGILTYRGYPIEQLAEKSTFLEVAFLLIYGSLPTKDQLDYWSNRIMRHTFIHDDLAAMMKSFRYNSHPMGMLISTVSAMSTLHPEANPALSGQDVYNSAKLRNKQIHRILGTMPTIAAFAYRHRIGRPYVWPSHKPLSYTENFMFMLDQLSNPNYAPHPRLARALDILFILHADHELNCSTAAMRHLASGGVDVYTCVAGAAGALYGPKHGGANEAVLRMLESIGSVDNIPQFIANVKARKVLLMGFGHRVYKNYDPRARIIRQVAEEVFQILGREPLIEVAVALEKIALADPYFIKRKLYPNVDFYSGLIYKAMGFPTDMFPVLFAIPRTAGWLAHWVEFLADPENRIIRPRQVYLGADRRDYVDINKRSTASKDSVIVSDMSAESKRRFASSVTP